MKERWKTGNQKLLKRTATGGCIDHFWLRRETRILAGRDPAKPRQMGISVVHVIKNHGNKRVAASSCAQDGISLIDMKPSIAHVAASLTKRAGWLRKA